MWQLLECTPVHIFFIWETVWRGKTIIQEIIVSTHQTIVCNNKRVCVILITMHNNLTCMLLSIYMPGNNYCMTSVRPEFSDTLDCIESLFNTINCNAQICCGDYNMSFDKRDAHLVERPVKLCAQTSK